MGLHSPLTNLGGLLLAPNAPPCAGCRLATGRSGGDICFLVVAGVGLLAITLLLQLQCLPPRRFPRLQLGLCVGASAWWLAGMIAFAGEWQGSDSVTDAARAVGWLRGRGTNSGAPAPSAPRSAHGPALREQRL